MPRPYRWRRIAIWTGAALSTLIAAAWMASGWQSFDWGVKAGTQVRVLWLSGGCCGMTCDDARWFGGDSAAPWPGSFHRVWFGDYAKPGPHWKAGFSWKGRSKGSGGRLSIPLWLPFLLIAAPTAWTWHVSRRVPPGHCPKCRYDLTGIATATCPECGTAITPATTLSNSP